MGSGGHGDPHVTDERSGGPWGGQTPGRRRRQGETGREVGPCRPALRPRARLRDGEELARLGDRDDQEAPSSGSLGSCGKRTGT